MRPLKSIVTAGLLCLAGLGVHGQASQTAIAAVPVYSERSAETSLEQATRWLTGSFQSSFNQFDASMTLEIERIWHDRADGPWFLMSRSGPTPDSIEMPKRVLKVFDKDGKVHIRFHYLPKLLEFPGDKKSSDPLAGVTPEQLVARQGCDIVLWQENSMSFEGDNSQGSCFLPHDPSVRSSVEVMLSPSMLSLKIVGVQDGQTVFGNATPTLFMRQQKAEDLIADTET